MRKKACNLLSMALADPSACKVQPPLPLSASPSSVEDGDPQQRDSEAPFESGR